MAPEIIRIRPKLNKGLDKNSCLLIALKISIDMARMATTDIATNTHVLFLKNPKAAPVLVTNVMCRIFFIIGMESPTKRLSRMRAFDHWSIPRIKRIENREIRA